MCDDVSGVDGVRDRAVLGLFGPVWIRLVSFRRKNWIRGILNKDRIIDKAEGDYVYIQPISKTYSIYSTVVMVS